MKNVGIICEYNPFHLGHERQIRLARQSGAEHIICVMSGSFTQRGEPAIVDKYRRAEAAIRCGADVVAELPFPFCSMSAEGFARTGVYILGAMGVDTLCFGCECGDIKALAEASEAAASGSFREKYTELQRNTNGTTSAYLKTLEEFTGKKTNFGSNDLLGISYLRAIKELDTKITPFAIKREGSNYRDRTTGDGLPSAMAVREIISSCGIDTDRLEKLMPKPSLDCLAGAVSDGVAPISEKVFFSHILSFFRLHTPDEITQRAISLCGGKSILDDGSGIINRICACAENATSEHKFYDSVFSSRYTDARIKRVILYSMLGVSDGTKNLLPDYTLLLGASRAGCEWLSEIRKSSDIKIVTKPADTPGSSIVSALSRRADGLYTMLMPRLGAGDYFIKKSPFIN